MSERYMKIDLLRRVKFDNPLFLGCLNEWKLEGLVCNPSYDDFGGYTSLLC